MISPPARGEVNMAVDEAILSATVKKESPPTLRLYAWDPGCLSLGYTQTIKDVDLHALTENGWSLVRRPTGGKAVLHVDELTYAVIAAEEEPLVAGSVLESYRRIAGGLLAALHALNLPARADKAYGGSLPGASNGPVCFEVPSNYEITADGKKLIGSAQARRFGGVLQHGSLPLYGDITRIIRVLHFNDEASRQDALARLCARATTVEKLLGRRIEWTEAARIFITAFSKELDLKLVPGQLTPAEKDHVRVLIQEKYSQPGWNGKF